MKENNNLAELTLEELLIKQKKAKGAVIGLSIVMAVALITLIYLVIKSKNYVLLAVAGGSGLNAFTKFYRPKTNRYRNKIT